MKNDMLTIVLVNFKFSNIFLEINLKFFPLIKYFWLISKIIFNIKKKVLYKKVFINKTQTTYTLIIIKIVLNFFCIIIFKH